MIRLNKKSLLFGFAALTLAMSASIASAQGRDEVILDRLGAYLSGHRDPLLRYSNPILELRNLSDREFATDILEKLLLHEKPGVRARAHHVLSLFAKDEEERAQREKEVSGPQITPREFRGRWGSYPSAR